MEVSKTAAAPIERVKLLIQSQDKMIKAGRLSEPYKGISDCFARTMKDEGVIALWRGNTANVSRYFPTQAPNFAFKDYFKKLTRPANDAKKSGERQFNGWIDVYKKTIRSDGIAGIYHGFNISCVGIKVFRGLYSGTYDFLKPVVLVGGLQDSFFASFLLGWGITTGAGLASYPIDTKGAKSLFKGAGANILRAVAGAGVLAG
ncbi:hypothetical protein Patl1_21103 [Pistacia atlantica]|uniref:Uncharacterized protein n=1 Tax=Pistacia atlantica TaxID=434234 RepID=A0ACC1BLD2_9ROSI|nr:hypothetical protein Patl1_21103 [Pistacia atlantica]